jgi:uncharacterized protein YndB with AHSA1/START domain
MGRATVFGLLKKKTQNDPLEQTHEIDIEAPAADVFRLLDFSAPQHHMRHRGVRVEAVSGQADQFVGRDPSAPDWVFQFKVLECRPQESITFVSRIEGDFPGGLEEARSAYRITPKGDNACQLDVRETSIFKDGLSRRQRQEEEALMQLAFHNDLYKLKDEAEQGLGAE